MRQVIINIIRSVGYHLNTMDRRTPITLLNDEAMQDSYEFIRERLSDAVLFSDIQELRKFVIDKVSEADSHDGLILEFGVFKGHSINLFADRLREIGLEEPIYGFDSFEGLEEDWGHTNFPRGSFERGGKLPKVRRNVRLIKGRVQATLDNFLREMSGKKIVFMHLDLDTYSPTKYVLDRTRELCGSGTVILFDELYGYPNWREHEFKALNEVYAETEYEYLAFGPLQCAIKLR